ncbi:hypothetical protein NDU88_002081 [Pleurodeles waltl]|uniref:Uncharacterized protein n=1 Tax=Pleurodeles waltl TaxID=8319 RepID=A0AAV7VA73_PLEWA|nr:hypothetical protein NDU88_002081 [Pleurodeles waltl]
MQARQLLQVARTQGPLRLGSLEIRISAGFSKGTTVRRRAFLSLRAQLRRLDVKFGLFEPARMWITKNGETQNFYNPEDLRAFPENMQDQMQGQTQSMETTAQTTQPAWGPPSGASRSAPASELEVRSTIDPKPGEEILRDSPKAMTTGDKYFKQWRCTRSCRTETNPAPL